MTRAVFINPHSRARVYQSLDTAIEPPVWCRILAGHARDNGFGVSIVDAEAEGLSLKQVADRCHGADLAVIVAFGHQPSAATQTMPAAFDLCAAIAEPTLLVGGHVSTLPRRTLQESGADYVCNGEGPETVLGLLSGAALEDVPGLVWGGGENKPAPLMDMTDLHGNVWDLLPMDRYRAHNWQGFGWPRQPYASIHTSLGCPYKCSFCCINAPFHANRYRMRSPADVVREVKRLIAEYGVRTFKIVDEMFVMNDRHYTAICEGLTGEDINIWAYARIDTVKPDKLALLRRAGVQWLALGIESGSAHVRDGAEKSFDQDDIREIVRQIHTAGINVIGNYIFGLPDDDLQTMRQTLDLAKELNCEFANFYSAMAYPGSRLFDQAKTDDLPAAWSGYSQHSVDSRPLPTAKCSSREVLAFRDAAFQEYYSDPRYLDMVSRKFGATVVNGIREMANTPLERVA